MTATASRWNGSAKVALIPWDPDSAQHVERLYRQRIACGWNSHLVEAWRAKQRGGNKAVHWIMFANEDKENDRHLAQHTAQWPNERGGIWDTATSLQGIPRIPNPEFIFVPIGHISLDSENSDSTLADASQGLYCITALYISSPLQGIGLGSVAMDAVERQAVEEPLRAKMLALDTVAREEYFDLERWKAHGKRLPKAPVQDWYERRGYYVYKHEKVRQGDIKGEVWALDAVFLKKMLL